MRHLYEKRTQIPYLIWRPPPLWSRPVLLFSRWWSYLIPVFRISDFDLTLVSGMDTLILIRFLVMCVQIHWPIMILGLAVLFPLYWTGNGLNDASSESSANLSASMRGTLSNLEKGSGKLWLPFIIMLLYTTWTCAVLWYHIRSYIVIRIWHLESRKDGSIKQAQCICTQDKRPWRLIYELLWPPAMHHTDIMAAKKVLQLFEEHFFQSDTLQESNKSPEPPDDDVKCKAVIPWWLPPEKQSPSICAAAGAPAHQMLGKIPPRLRGRIMAKAATGACVFEPIESYAVLFLKAGFVVNRELVYLLRTHHDHGRLRMLQGVSVLKDKEQQESSKQLAYKLSEDLDRLQQAALPRHEVKKKAKVLKTAMQAMKVGSLLDESLRTLFPEEYTALVHCYDQQPVDDLLLEWDHTMSKLLKVRHDLKQGRLKKKNKAILHTQQTELTDKISMLEDSINKTRAQVLETPLDTSYIALFNSQEAAAAAVSGKVGLIPGIQLTASAAPSPEDINWPALQCSWRARFWRGVIVLFPLTIVMLFPIGVMTGALTNLPEAVCGQTPIYGTNADDWGWLCGDTFGNLLMRLILCQLLPVIISTFWDTFVMPILLYLCVQSERRHNSLSSLDRRIAYLFFIYNIVNGFLFPVIGGSVLQQLGAAIKSPAQIFNLLGTALPAASNYFINLVIVKALFVNIFRFVWPHDGTILFYLFRLVGLCRPKSERDEAVIRSAPSYRSGRHFGSFTQVVIMSLCYAVISPLILPAAFVFFLTAWVTWRFHAMYFYEPIYESGGLMNPGLVRSVLDTLFLSLFFTGFVLIASKGYWQGALLIALGWLIPGMFALYIKSIDMVRQATIIINRKAAKVVVDKNNYLPPALRPGAVGWQPEAMPGQPWEKYGLPKKTP